MHSIVAGPGATEVALFPSAQKALADLDHLAAEIRNAPSMDTVEAAANAAAGYQRMFKPVKAVADRAGEVWVEAEVRIGEERKKVGKAKGTRGQFRGKPKGEGSSGSPIVAPPDEAVPTVLELGIDKKRLLRAEKLADLREDERAALTAELKAADKAGTPAALLAASRKNAKAEKRQVALTAVFSETGPFDVVVIDPPWPMLKIDRDERPNQDAFDYDVMTLEQIEAFWPSEIASHLKDDCHVLCWTTEKFLPATLALLEKWDLRYVLTMVWHKPGGFQPHDLPQYNAEFIVYARKGAPVFTDTKDFNVCNSWPRREHSRKPAEFYELIARVTGGSRLDVFAREAHPGFAQFGKEIFKFPEVA
ncbi:S-adenosylmethionine-binding domain-containing protein [Bradyrhizobium sp. CCGUVB1N3]|uniref:S-adenosylmethionine-binding domain-containing protein n=1 Tax=Bradyrhizobium sp. CCGUVB1N3 TaxID=2949629 RepID=UPI0020B18E16|nr:S-adenosylmethionine-binding domain-containing protein [Bradyrhizobium sp. CCGUVB1N3]MCP3471367.1 S-adenosylmethionine-binding domain-containing protein [Bradyrhizobium sp. CCGUVB1N3]